MASPMPSLQFKGLVKPLPALVVAMAAALTGCGSDGGSAGAGAGAGGKSIRYQVDYFGSPQTGPANRAMTISYATKDGTTELQNVPLPWATIVDAPGAGFTASVKAQFYGFGTISCRIMVDDQLIQQYTSREDPYPKVECTA